jgi:enoyl-CoA hydratase/carnithine racemase
MIGYELEAGVARIALRRPEKRNAISDALLAALIEAVERAQGEAGAIVIHGEGPCFSAGLDLSEHRAREAHEVFAHSRGWHAAFARIARGRLPVIAALHGACVGGGLELAAACHLRVADTTAFLALPEGSRGIFVGGGASVRVARLMGASRIADMMLTGRVVDAATAERWGAVNHLVAEGAALAEAMRLAARAAEVPVLTRLGILEALPRIQDMAEEDGLFVESLVAALAQTGPEARARLDAFLAGRAAKLRPDAP